MNRPLKFEMKPGLQEVEFNGEAYGRPAMAFQHGKLQMWITVDSSKPSGSLLFYVALTGEALPEGYYYEPCGTAINGDASSVLHLYRVDKR